MRTKSVLDILRVTFISNPLTAILGTFGPTVDYKTVFPDYTIRGYTGDFTRKPLLLGNNFNEAGLFKVLAAAGGLNISETSWTLFNLAIFQCPTARAASYRVDHNVPVWRYLYFGDFYNLQLTSNPPSGAYHTEEIPVVWETTQDAVTVANTPNEVRVSRFLNSAWAAFARNPYENFHERRFSFPNYNPLSKSVPFRCG